MKLKSLTMLVMSGVLTTSLAYITPAIADDTNNDNAAQSVQPPSDANAQNQTNGADNSANPQDDTSASNEGTPDTATGDDDY